MRSTEYHLSNHELKYLRLLAENYPIIQAVCTEIINLQAILNPPKGTEHFMSDPHGKYDALCHIANNCFGVIREKVDLVFGKTLSGQECSEICTLIYYPEQKLRYIKQTGSNLDAWYQKTLHQLIGICRITVSKYTWSKARKALSPEFSYIVDELLHAQPGEDSNQQVYHAKIIDTIIGTGNADESITALCSLIKRLAVDCLHIVGDTFDRGPGTDRIMDLLMRYHAVDVEWGNHDILWMGAASGGKACAAAVVCNTVVGGDLAMLESGYGISMRELAIFARKQHLEYGDLNHAIRKATSITPFKLEGQLTRRHPEFQMEHRMLLYQISYEQGMTETEGKTCKLNTTVFPTVSRENPYELTEEEKNILHGLIEDSKESERLNRHMRFLHAKGSMYKCLNQNLLFHGCIPMTVDGELTGVNVGGWTVKGKELMDLSDKLVRRVYFAPSTAVDKPFCLDYMWYLWNSKDSPLFGREKMTTFEHMFIDDKSAWMEKKNPYYKRYNQEEVCGMLLREFGLNTPFCHIINGHVPVHAGDEESPIKAGGKLIAIDGGLCEAYHPTTRIAGYTLIYNSHGVRTELHQSFDGVRSVLEENKDTQSRSDVFETHFAHMMVMDIDNGNDISNQIYDLTMLFNVYRQGLLSPKVTK